MPVRVKSKARVSIKIIKDRVVLGYFRTQLFEDDLSWLMLFLGKACGEHRRTLLNSLKHVKERMNQALASHEGSSAGNGVI